MVFLRRLSLHGYKSIAELQDFALQPRNVLIGANGAGKSNLLSFFDLLRAIAAGQLATAVASQGGASVLLHQGAKRTPTLSFELEFEGFEPKSYRLELTATPQDGLAPTLEEARRHDGSTQSFSPSTSEAAIRFGVNSSPPGSWVHYDLTLLRRYHFHDTSAASPLRKSVDVNDNEELRSDGSNLAAFLYLLKSKHQVEFQLMMNYLRRVAPFIRELVVEPLALTPGLTRLRWRHSSAEGVFDVSALSDGTLRFLALLAVLLQPMTLRPRPPFLVIIDEPELGLHPFAIRILGALIRSASTQRQMLIATQSPLLLDEFAPEDVIVTELQDGASTFRRLNSEQLQSWLADFSLGELWEKNELGGRPR